MNRSIASRTVWNLSIQRVNSSQYQTSDTESQFTQILTTVQIFLPKGATERECYHSPSNSPSHSQSLLSEAWIEPVTSAQKHACRRLLGIFTAYAISYLSQHGRGRVWAISPAPQATH
jgi:hypothetical protein